MRTRRALLSAAAGFVVLPDIARAQFYNPSAFYLPTPKIPILDQITTTAAHAYSLRKLTKTYAGKAINVRRSSDNTTKDIGFIVASGNLDTATLLSFVGANDGFVATWYDQVGSTSLTAPTTAQQPRIVTSGALDVTGDGNLGLNFGYSFLSLTPNLNTVLQNTSVTYTNGDSFTVHCSASPGPGSNDGVTSEFIWRQSNFYNELALDHNKSYEIPQYANDFAGEIFSENNLTPGDGIGGSAGIANNIHFSFNNCTVQARWTELFASTGIVVGDNSPGFNRQSYNGWVLELIIYPVDLNSADRATIFANQQQFYDIGTFLLHDCVCYQMSMGYSTRQLRKGYRGPLINVRRSSDNTTMDIGAVGGNLDTATLLSFCGAGNGFVATWYDQGVWGNNVTQSTPGNQPQIVASGTLITQNGKPTLLFNTTINGTVGLGNTSPSFPNGPIGAVFMVEKSTITSFPAFSQSCPFTVFHGAGWNTLVSGSGSSSNWDTALNAGHIVGINGTNSNGVTGNLETTSAVCTPATNGGSAAEINIGFIPSQANSSFAGYIGEIYIPGEGPQTNPNDVATIHSNQKAYWGTP